MKMADVIVIVVRPVDTEVLVSVDLGRTCSHEVSISVLMQISYYI